MRTLSPTHKLFLSVAAVIGWFAVILQLYLIILNSTQSVPDTIVRFFSYFTILTNILVAVYFTMILLQPDSPRGVWLRSSTVSTAVAVYIIIVGLVYNLILRALWEPKGLQKLADELLHSVVPLLFVIYWLVFAAKGGLKWKQVFPWLLYPLIYSIYVFIRGEISGLYPYPFIDVNELGYDKVLVNAGFMLIAFLVCSLLLVGIAKVFASRKAASRS